MKALLIIFLLVGCTATPRFHERPIVVSITAYTDHCTYGMKAQSVNDVYYIKDECGKFNIGDTLKVVKK